MSVRRMGWVEATDPHEQEAKAGSLASGGGFRGPVAALMWEGKSARSRRLRLSPSSRRPPFPRSRAKATAGVLAGQELK